MIKTFVGGRVFYEDVTWGDHCQRAWDLGIVDTPKGSVVAFHMRQYKDGGVEGIVPGYFERELTPIEEDGRLYRRIEVRTVPVEEQEGVSKVLREGGYSNDIT